jgi:alkylation response protein AidB-like acyl-CoA dehydrogenase
MRLGSEPEGAPGLFEALRLIGRASLPLGCLYEGHVNAVRLAVRHGTELQRELIRSAVLEGRLFGVWNTESPDLGLRMDEGRLVGGKILCSGIGLVERALVTARPAMGGPQQMWLVPLELLTPRGDLSDWNPSGMRSSATGRIDLGGISLGDCLKLGGPDDYLAQPDFSGGA